MEGPSPGPGGAGPGVQAASRLLLGTGTGTKGMTAPWGGARQRPLPWGHSEPWGLSEPQPFRRGLYTERCAAWFASSPEAGGRQPRAAGPDRAGPPPPPGAGRDPEARLTPGPRARAAPGGRGRGSCSTKDAVTWPRAGIGAALWLLSCLPPQTGCRVPLGCRLGHTARGFGTGWAGRRRGPC